MQKITALKSQKRNKERLNVYLDGEFAFGLALEAAVNLQVGQLLSAEQIDALKDEDEFAAAREKALRFLSYRPRSIDEVRRNLWRKEIDEAVIEKVVAYLRERELLDDRAFARYWVEQRETFKPRGRRALHQELRKKGVERQIIDDVLQSVNEREAAERAARKRARRWSHLPYDTFRQKLGGYLQRRGFDYEIVRSTIETAWQETAQENSGTERS
jgi:regulatory protein